MSSIQLKTDVPGPRSRALPECPITVKGRSVVVAPAAEGVGPVMSIERVMAQIPDARTYLSW